MEQWMTVLIYGGAGAREHVLARWANRSPQVARVLCFASNAGIERLRKVEVHTVPASDDALVAFCESEEVDLVIIGPEAPLEKGVADLLRGDGINIFGPNADAARLETSKAYGVEFMNEFGVPVAETTVHRSLEQALCALEKRTTWPVVVKYDGLAGGKGVTVCDSHADAAEALVRRYGSETDATMLLQEYLPDSPDLLRSEFSVHVLVACDGSYKILPVLQDYKPEFDGDEGRMTGGMGCFGPFPGLELDGEMMRLVKERIIIPTIDGLQSRGQIYQCVLYFGLKWTPYGPYVVEYNVRFGDPEVVGLAGLIRSDMIPVLYRVARGGGLDDITIEYRDDAAVVLVVANESYPDPGEACTFPEHLLLPTTYHAATRREGDRVVADGGRIACLTARAPTIPEARAAVYKQLEGGDMPGLRVRGDIALGYGD